MPEFEKHSNCLYISDTAVLFPPTPPDAFIKVYDQNNRHIGNVQLSALDAILTAYAYPPVNIKTAVNHHGND